MKTSPLIDSLEDIGMQKISILKQNTNYFYFRCPLCNNMDYVSKEYVNSRGYQIKRSNICDSCKEDNIPFELVLESDFKVACREVINNKDIED